MKYQYIVIISIFINSCVYISKPCYYKLTRGNWEQDTSCLHFSELPQIVKDTLSKYYKSYYVQEDIFYPELISLEQDINTFNSLSDYENKIFIKYNLKKSNFKKNNIIKKNCNKTSNYNFVNDIAP